MKRPRITDDDNVDTVLSVEHKKQKTQEIISHNNNDDLPEDQKPLEHISSTDSTFDRIALKTYKKTHYVIKRDGSTAKINIAEIQTRIQDLANMDPKLLNIDAKIATKKTMTRGYGMNMNTVRRAEGMKAYQEWLLRPRGSVTESDGTVRTIRNIDLIRDRGDLLEIIMYNGKNADRISCAIIGMYYEKELQYTNRRPGTKKKVDPFFQQALF